jgi:hypothetical protein
MKKRMIPRYVSGSFVMFRLNIYGLIFMIFPIIFISVLLFKFNFKPYLVLVSSFVIGISYALLIVYPNRETGYEQIASLIKYKIEGEKIYTRDSDS